MLTSANGDTTDDNDDTNHVVTIASGIMTFSTGIFLTGARLVEPLFRVFLISKIYQFFGKIYVPNMKDISSLDELKA